MDGDSGATSIVSVPQIERGLEKAVMLERYIAVQIRVTHNNGFFFGRSTKLASRILCSCMRLICRLLVDNSAQQLPRTGHFVIEQRVGNTASNTFMPRLSMHNSTGRADSP